MKSFTELVYKLDSCKLCLNVPLQQTSASNESLVYIYFRLITCKHMDATLRGHKNWFSVVINLTVYLYNLHSVPDYRLFLVLSQIKFL